MSDVTLSHIYKVYPNGVQAVSDFNIQIKDKEFIVFVGPSGCGKSTTLRMIAGLEDITAGDLFIGPDLMNDVQPKDRDIAMVFQNYALYPHMTVYENIAFSLRNKHMPKEEINRRVLEAAKILGIEDYLQRKPKAMSGGQRQRVSLGRAIVRNPKVFLLDEPLSNLDAKLRAQMRTEISKLHKKLATTFIYVTHDQVEAMTMADRIVVMKLGVVQQIDTPTNLYDHPLNKFVAGFIGTPQMNFFDVTMKKEGKEILLTFEDGQKISVPYEYFLKCDPDYFDGKTHVTLGARPDNILLAEEGGLKAVISQIERLGNETLLYCDLANLVNENDSVTKASIIIKVEPTNTNKIGDEVHFVFDNSLLKVFEQETKNEAAIMPFCPTYSKARAVVKGDKIGLYGQTIDKPKAYEALKDGEYEVKIPNASVIDGRELVLPVYKCEKVADERYLVTLKKPDLDDVLFCTSPIPVEEGKEISVGLALEDLTFTKAGTKEAVVSPIVHHVEAIGCFVKEKERVDGKKKALFFGELEDGTDPKDRADKASYELNDTFVRRLYAIEQRKMTEDPFRLGFTPKIVSAGEKSIRHTAEKVLDYGKKQYLLVKIGESENYIDVTGALAEGQNDVSFTFDHEQPLEVYTLDTNVRIM